MNKANQSRRQILKIKETWGTSQFTCMQKKVFNYVSADFLLSFASLTLQIHISKEESLRPY
jgi:hypothetical protein